MKSRKKVGKNGEIIWKMPNGQLHRDNGPAVIYKDGTKVWWKHGKIHREDGPACEFTDGNKWWFFDGQNTDSEKEHKQMLRKLKLKALGI